MSNDTVVSLAALAQVSDPLTELLRSGARRLAAHRVAGAASIEALRGAVLAVGILTGRRHRKVCTQDYVKGAETPSRTSAAIL